MEQKKKKVVDIEKACEMLGCDRWRFYRKHYKNIKIAGKIGRTVYLDLKALEKYIEERQENDNDCVFEIVK